MSFASVSQHSMPPGMAAIGSAMGHLHVTNGYANGLPTPLGLMPNGGMIGHPGMPAGPGGLSQGMFTSMPGMNYSNGYLAGHIGYQMPVGLQLPMYGQGTFAGHPSSHIQQLQHLHHQPQPLQQQELPNSSMSSRRRC